MNERKEKVNVLLTCFFSVLHALGYLYHGFIVGFDVCIYTMMFFDVLFIPAFFIKKGRLLKAYLVIFSTALVFITAFTTSRLYNNYSGLLCLFIAVLIFPKHKNIFMGFYLFVAAIAFAFAGDPVYKLIIHTSRALWIFILYDLVIMRLYNRKPVILYDDEKEIIKQLVEGKLIKEIEFNNYSERTIRRRLDEARKRNGITEDDHNNKLKEIYKTSLEN